MSVIWKNGSVSTSWCLRACLGATEGTVIQQYCSDRGEDCVMASKAMVTLSNITYMMPGGLQHT